jgi:hypothetical protein
VTYSSRAGLAPDWLGLANGNTIWLERRKHRLYVRHTCGAEWEIPSGVNMNAISHRIGQHICADLLPHRVRPKLTKLVRESLLLKAAGLAGLFTLFSASLVWFFFVSLKG